MTDSLPTLTSTICGLYYKSLTIVIYDRIDSGKYYKSMIMIVSYAPHLTLALSSVVNYDRSDATIWSVTY
jgi:hypothetical protein